MKIKELNHKICRLGECPVWNEINKSFYWSDILLGKIYQYSTITEAATLIYETDRLIGGMLLDEKKDLILFTDKDVRILNIKTKNIEIIYQMDFEVGERFNDVIADKKGRFFAGTMDAECSKGKLYRFEKGRKPQVILENLGITNGMGFSTDNKTFYHTDSVPKTITKYEYNIENGNIANPSIFFEMNEKDGCPDGMIVDLSNNIWTACWGGGQIIKLSKNGEIIEKIAIPAKQPSSLAIGNNEILVTSAACEADNLETGYNNDGVFVGGKSYILT